MQQLRTRLNGGKSPVQEVANAWKKEDHDFPWSKLVSDKWSVELAKKLKDLLLKHGSAKPDPRNIHEN